MWAACILLAGQLFAFTSANNNSGDFKSDTSQISDFQHNPQESSINDHSQVTSGSDNYDSVFSVQDIGMRSRFEKYNDDLKLRHHFANLLKEDNFLTPMMKLAEERFNKFRVSDPEKAKIYNECILLASILLGKKDISVLEGWPASISASEDSVRYRLADIGVWSQTNFMFEPGTWIDTMNDYVDGQPKPKEAVKEVKI